MMKNWYQHILIVALATILLVSSTFSLAATAVNPVNPPNAICPSVDQLVKEGLIWSGPEGWKSTDDSFIDKIENFMGAQWIGINLGHIVCFYRGTEEYTFPVTLERSNLLVPKPAGENWGKDQGGYTICSSKDPKKCAFYIEQTKEKGQSPAEQLKKFKSS